MEPIQSGPMTFQWALFRLSDEDTEAHFLALGITGSGRMLGLKTQDQSWSTFPQLKTPPTYSDLTADLIANVFRRVPTRSPTN